MPSCIGFRGDSTCCLLACKAILKQILKYYFASVFCLCYFVRLFQLLTTGTIKSGFKWTEHYILLELLTLNLALCCITTVKNFLFFFWCPARTAQQWTLSVRDLTFDFSVFREHCRAVIDTPGISDYRSEA